MVGAVEHCTLRSMARTNHKFPHITGVWACLLEHTSYLEDEVRRGVSAQVVASTAGVHPSVSSAHVHKTQGGASLIRYGVLRVPHQSEPSVLRCWLSTGVAGEGLVRA